MLEAKVEQKRVRPIWYWDPSLVVAFLIALLFQMGQTDNWWAFICVLPLSWLIVRLICLLAVKITYVFYKPIYLIKARERIGARSVEEELYVKNLHIRLAFLISTAGACILSLIAGYLIVTGREPILSLAAFVVLTLLLSMGFVLRKASKNMPKAQPIMYQSYEQGYRPLQQVKSIGTDQIDHLSSENYEQYEQPSATYPQAPLQEQG